MGCGTPLGPAGSSTNEDSVKRPREVNLEAALQKRTAAFQASPMQVKLLAVEYGLTPGQIRGLLSKYGDDRKKIAEEAAKLRKG
jgi:hypothetical protein